MRRKYYNISGIYQIQSLINNKLYIGSAVNLNRRKKEHWDGLKQGIHHSILLQRHVNKYGIDDLQFSVIEYCRKEKLIEREQHYLDSLNPKFNICKVAGSCLGIKRSEESKQKNREYAVLKMSNPINREILRKAAIKQFSNPLLIERLSTLAKNRTGDSNGMFGRHHSVHTIEKIRKQKLDLYKVSDNPMLGKKHSKETKLIMSDKRKNCKKVTCPYCNVIMDVGNYGKYHGNKCKSKPKMKRRA